MYYAPTPTLMIRAACPCVILVNGALAGECSEDSYIALPISDTGEYYLTALPITGGGGEALCPVSRRLSFERGSIASPPEEDALMCAWPGGVYEVTLCPALLHCERRCAPPETLDAISPSIDGKRYELTLYLDSGARLSIHRDGVPLGGYALGPAKDGALSLVELNGAKYISVRLTLYGGERLALLDAKLRQALDITGDMAFIEDGAPVSIEMLNTVRGHERRTRYAYRDGAFAAEEPETGFFSAQPHKPANKLERAVAFAEALRYGLNEEAMGFLSPSLADSVTAEDLRDFFGEYERIRPPASDLSGDTLGLVGPVKDNVRPVRVFAFEHGEKGIENITEL